MSSLFVGVVWGYAALLLVGGLMGFLLAGSRISLVVSAVCSVTFILVALRIAPPLAAPIEAGGLAVFFLVRAVQGRKPMPGIPLAFLSLLAAGLMGWQLAAAAAPTA